VSIIPDYILTLAITVIKIAIPLVTILSLVPLLVWVERKGSAFIQDRHGPNRARIKGIRLGGLLHPIVDVVKLFTKEDFIPGQANKFFYLLAPFLALTIACVTYLIIPFAQPLTIDGKEFTIQAANLDVGILYILAMSSLGVFGVMLAGWASNSKYSLFGGVRSSAQMFSYELSMGLAIISVVLVSGTLDLNQIVVQQSEYFWNWNFLKLFPACLLFIVSSFAETNRNPFDLPEGESEIVAGFHLEYSSMKFGMFFMAEYAHMVVASALIVVLFFGGWQVPFLSTAVIRGYADIGLFLVLLGAGMGMMIVGAWMLSLFRKGKYGDKRDYEVLIFGAPLLVVGLILAIGTLIFGAFHLNDLGQQIFAATIQFGTFMGKVLFFCWLFIWIRWTLPRFRYDQLMRLGWKVMLPLALVWIGAVGAGLFVLF
jgi:NADH-quinone oxidoreductase subunit H